MSSDKQIAANQANAQKSTGPTSTLGREKVSRNATRHGLLARTVVLERESHDRFLLLLAEFHEALEPANPIEVDLVEKMACARWRLTRIWSMEKASLDGQIRQQEATPVLAESEKRTADSSQQQEPGQEPAVPTDPSQTAARAFQTLGDQSRALDLHQRYEAHFERLYNRSLDRLMKLREKRFMTKQDQLPLLPDES